MCIFFCETNAIAKPDALRSQTLRTRGDETGTDLRNRYPITLLKAALEITDPLFGKMELIVVNSPNSSSSLARSLEDLNQNKVVDVEVATTSQNLEAMFEPSRVPIDFGYTGIQMLLSRNEMSNRFSASDKSSTLKKFRMGLQLDSPELQVYKRTGWLTAPSPTYLSLFEMLINRRFDFAPRAILDLWEERTSFGKGELSVENRFLIEFPSAKYFFFQKKNAAVARRIEKGLLLLQKNNTMQELFTRMRSSQLPAGTLLNRNWITLKNTELPATPPIGYTSWEHWWAAQLSILKQKYIVEMPDKTIETAPKKIRFLGPGIRDDFRLFLHGEALTMALKETIDEGPFQLLNVNENFEQSVNQADALQKLSQAQDLEVVGSMLTSQRAKNFAFAKFDLASGLLGDRVFVTLQSKARALETQSSTEFKSNKICIGIDWPDKEIMLANNYSIVAIASLAEALDALAKGKCEALSRASFEATDEILANPLRSLALVREQQIQYPAALVFFTNKKNTALAGRIERGLKLARKNGSYLELLSKYYGPSVRGAWSTEAGTAQLNNPTFAFEDLLTDAAEIRTQFFMRFATRK